MTIACAGFSGLIPRQRIWARVDLRHTFPGTVRGFTTPGHS